MELKIMKNNKRNIIVSSPYEYNFYKMKLNYSDNYMHKAGLPRYDRFISIKKNNSERQCILITFTYRKYSYELYKKSLFKKNIEILLKNKLLINFLKEKKIDLIYIPHHFDVLRNRTINPKKIPYVKYTGQELLGHYIEQCSLFITDFSSISIDFMFLNKPSLFYLIDLKDKIKFEEREYMQYDYEHYFGNVFVSQKELIKRVKYYANRGFKIDNELRKNYESVFYYKKNITEKIIDIINEIIKKK
jgi:CDP-glycerol glycerophosphotransferase (TagB/SpsB family)